MKRNLNLVVTRAGPQSLHAEWLMPPDKRNFDLLVSSYSNELPAINNDNVKCVFVPGKKVEGWHNTLRACWQDFLKYERVAFIDDDIICNAADISRCFSLGKEYNLSIWQPSLSWDSYFTYGGTLHNPHLKLRYVNYVEMMCPFFTIDSLNNVKKTFSLGYESGIDLIWGSLIPPNERCLGIIDAIQVKHTRPVGLYKEQNGFINKTYENDIYDCLRFFGMKWPSLVATGGITGCGDSISGLRVAFKIISLLLSTGSMKEPLARQKILTHLRHQFTRTPKYNDDAANILKLW